MDPDMDADLHGIKYPDGIADMDSHGHGDLDADGLFNLHMDPNAVPIVYSF